MEYHTPVLLQKSLEGLNIDPEGIYVDLTFGGGGHSKKIIQQLNSGKLFAFDQDQSAKKEAEKINDNRLVFIEANFRYMKKYLKVYGVNTINGLLADLGVSSFQINTSEKGFAFRFDDAPLDMRMNTFSAKTAEQILNKYSEEDLKIVFEKYGEVRNAKTLASAIVKEREIKWLKTAGDLKNITKRFTGKKMENKYNSKVFQALRIEVNDELKALESLLEQSKDCVESGGRMVFITYHSLEDRMVKNYINQGKCFGEAEKDIYGNKFIPFKAINKKPILPSEEEIDQNPRARSAKLRIAEKK